MILKKADSAELKQNHLITSEEQPIFVKKYVVNKNKWQYFYTLNTLLNIIAIFRLTLQLADS